MAWFEAQCTLSLAVLFGLGVFDVVWHFWLDVDMEFLPSAWIRFMFRSKIVTAVFDLDTWSTVMMAGDGHDGNDDGGR